MEEKIEWKEVQICRHDFSVKPEVFGVLLEKRKSNYKGNDYVLDVAGVLTLIYGKAALQSKLESMPIGTLVKIVYKGKVKSKNGMNYDLFQVFTKDTKGN